MKRIKTYNSTVDLIRAIAIIFVLVVHVFSEILTKTSPNALDWLIATFFVTFGKVAVPLFIMLSGFLLLEEQKKYTISEFYKKRILRIGLPLLFWPFFYYLAYIIFSPKEFNWTLFFNDYIFLNMYYHLYFLFIILGLYFITPILKPFINSLNLAEKKITICLMLLFSLIITSIHYYAPTRLNFWTIFTVFIPYISFYAAGNYLKYIKISKRTLINLLLFSVIIVLVTVFAKYLMQIYIYSNWINQYPADGLSIFVLPLSILSFIILFNAERNSKNFSNLAKSGLIRKLAVASFGIYLIHPLFLYLINKYTLNIHLNGLLLILYLFVKIVILLILSYLFTYILSKIPVLKKLIS